MKSFEKPLPRAAAVTAPLPEPLALMLCKGRLPHSLCVEGRNGTGRRSVALQTAGAVLCERDDGQMCGECPHCRKVLLGVHPDLTLLDGNADRDAFKLDNLRRALKAAWLEPNEAQAKVIILLEAQLLSHAAQNLLLKIMEEPPENTFFILVCSNRFSLLPTILSRVTVVAVPAPEPAACIAALQELVPGRSAEAYHRAAMLTGYSPGQSAKILCDEEENTLFESALSALQALAEDNPYRALTAAVPFEKNRQLQTRFLSVVSEMLAVRELTEELGLSGETLFIMRENLAALLSLAEGNAYLPLVSALFGELREKRK